MSYRLKYQADVKPMKYQVVISISMKNKDEYDITDAAYSADKDKNKALDKEVYNLFNVKPETKVKEDKKRNIYN